MFHKWWHPKSHTKLEIYMKSGNIIEIDGVIDWKVINGVNGVTSITIMQSVWAKYKLIVTTIELSQIEAVVSL